MSRALWNNVLHPAVDAAERPLDTAPVAVGVRRMQVKLAKIDYENFITDMLADRQFIEDHAALCAKGEVWRCILVQQRGHADGVLVMPEDGCFVGWAAYYQERGLSS